MFNKNRIIAGSLSIGIGIVTSIFPKVAFANEYSDIAMQFNPTANYAEDTNGITWFYGDLQDGTIELFGTNYVQSYLEVPNKIDGKTVTVINSIIVNASSNLETAKVKKIIIPNTVISIEKGAFLNLVNLEDIEMPGNIGIAKNAFFSCPNVRINGRVDSNNFNLTTDDMGLKFGWNKLGDNTYFVMNEQNEFRTGWFEYNGKRYYCYSNGEMATGFLNLGDNLVYYLDETSGSNMGNIVTGWKQIDGEWYYFNETAKDGNDIGLMQVSWLNTKGKWYYFYSDGKMAHDANINGYYIGSDGVWRK